MIVSEREREGGRERTRGELPQSTKMAFSASVARSMVSRSRVISDAVGVRVENCLRYSPTFSFSPFADAAE